jgi:hypothetical protein
VPQQQVTLFGKILSKEPGFGTLWEALDPYAAWNKDLKERRDPATHRIPLYVPPQFVTKEQAETHNRLMHDYWTQAIQLNFDRSDAIMRQLESIGEFIPVFAHDPADGAFPIYPTTSDDIGRLIGVFDAVEAFFHARQPSS